MPGLSNKIPRKIRLIAKSSLAGTLIRYGFVVRGILYILFGFYGFMASIGLSGHVNSTTDIVKILGAIPLGNAVLVAVFVGLVGYGVWGIIRAFIDPLKEGSTPGGILTRIGYFISGLSYLALSLIPLHLLLNMATVDSSNSKNSAKLLFSLPGGFWTVPLIGLVILAGGTGQIIYGFKENFRRSLQTGRLGEQKEIVLTAGKYGYIARGIVFSLIGIFFLRAGLTGDVIVAKDPGEILLWIWQQSGGSAFLGIISAGLVALGVYSITVSRAVKLKAHEKS